MSLFLSACALCALAQSGERLELAQSLAPNFEVSDHRLIDLDAAGERGAAKLVLLGVRGEVCVFAAPARQTGKFVFALDPRAAVKLADPARALVDFAKLGDRPGLDLIVMGAKDTRVHPRDGASFSPESVLLAKRASHGLRVGAPRFVDVCQDVNGDGRADLVVPSADRLKLFLAGAAPTGAAGTSPWPTFTQMASLAVEVNRSAQTEGRALSDVLSASFSIPSIVARDVNGDDRADLLVSEGSVRAFHLQAADASFPEAPSVSVDLKIFRDTIEKAELRPGHTLAVGDQATYEMRDLDGDGIPDFVIVHRRKVWVFHGTSAGPQFTNPSMIFKTADDITALQLMRLDADLLPDLLLVKVQVPTIAALVRGIFGEWDIEISAAGYLSKDGRTFETKPSKRAELAVRLPAILRLIRNPESFLKRFEEIGARFRRSEWGDFDGNGARDVLLASSDGKQLELWLANAGESEDERSIDGEELLAQLLFEDQQRVWDIDRIAGWLGGLAERRTAVLTGGKPSNAQFPIRPAETAELVEMESADLDNDGRAELVLTYTLIPGGACVFDVLRLVP